MTKQYYIEFMKNAVQFHNSHPELTVKEYEKMGVLYEFCHELLLSAYKNAKTCLMVRGNSLWMNDRKNSALKASSARYMGRFRSAKNIRIL